MEAFPHHDDDSFDYIYKSKESGGASRALGGRRRGQEQYLAEVGDI